MCFQYSYKLFDLAALGRNSFILYQLMTVERKTLLSLNGGQHSPFYLISQGGEEPRITSTNSKYLFLPALVNGCDDKQGVSLNSSLSRLPGWRFITAIFRPIHKDAIRLHSSSFSIPSLNTTSQGGRLTTRPPQPRSFHSQTL